MRTSMDRKRLFLDMQEHPENYSDEQLETMMADLDCKPNTEAVWERVSRDSSSQTRHSSLFTLHTSLQRYAAAFLLAAFLGVLSFAGYRAIRGMHETAPNKVMADSLEARKPSLFYEIQNGDTIFHFEDIRLDSILSIIGGHYHRQVVFRDKASQGLRLHMTCHTTNTLNDFVDIMNMFEGFKISQNFDTLFVDSDVKKEVQR